MIISASSGVIALAPAVESAAANANRRQQVYPQKGFVMIALGEFVIDPYSFDGPFSGEVAYGKFTAAARLESMNFCSGTSEERLSEERFLNGNWLPCRWRTTWHGSTLTRGVRQSDLPETIHVMILCNTGIQDFLDGVRRVAGCSFRRI